MVTPDQLPKKRGALKSTPKISLFWEATFEVSHTLLAGMMMVSKLEGKAVEVFSGSRLVVGQINGEFEARDQ